MPSTTTTMFPHARPHLIYSHQCYKGKYYHLERPLKSPRVVQRPHPPILIGGSGERKTLRLVAQYADACNLPGYLNQDQRRHKLDVLREHCRTLGRPYEQIEKTVSIVLHLTHDGRNGTMGPQAALDQIVALAEEGFDHVIFDLPNVTDLEPFDVLATRIIPVVEKIQRTGPGPFSS
jgi:hypothetical protein